MLTSSQGHKVRPLYTFQTREPASAFSHWSTRISLMYDVFLSWRSLDSHSQTWRIGRLLESIQECRQKIRCYQSEQKSMEMCPVSKKQLMANGTKIRLVCGGIFTASALLALRDLRLTEPEMVFSCLIAPARFFVHKICKLSFEPYKCSATTVS